MSPTSKMPPPKKMLVAAGIFLIPTIIVILVIVSLTHRTQKPSVKPTAGNAFNTALPSPNLPKGEQNKLEIYMKAQQDSIKAKQERAKDPYSQPGTNIENPAATVLPLAGGRTASSSLSPVTPPDANEQKVNERLQKIYAALGQASPSTPPSMSNPTPWSTVSSGSSPQVDRLERMIAALQSHDTTTSPQLQQVNQALDKILAIQHPSKSSGVADTTRPIPAIVSAQSTPASVDFPGQASSSETNGFFSANDDADSVAMSAAPLMAVVHSTQTIVSGSIIKLRLLQDMYVSGQRIPANSFIYGPATVTGERIAIQLSNVSYGEKIYPIALKVFDAADGLEGIFVPGMITRDVVKENMSQGVSGITLGTLDPSLGAQAASAGIETARNLLSRKIRLVKATLKEGHLVILRPLAQNQ